MAVSQVLEQLYREGKARAIGVSNYTIQHLKDLIAAAEVKPMVNQVKMGGGAELQQVATSKQAP